MRPGASATAALKARATYRAKAEQAQLLLSMSRPGMPYDNAMAESFFGTPAQYEERFNCRHLPVLTRRGSGNDSARAALPPLPAVDNDTGA